MNELEWLKDAQPATPEPDTASARAALLAHITADGAAPRQALETGAAAHGAEPAHQDAYAALRRRAAVELDEAPRPVRARRPRLGKRERRAEAARARRAVWRPRLAFASAAVLVAATLAVAWPVGDDPSTRFATPVTPAPDASVVEAPLVRLSEKIAAEPEPTGDATLVVRIQKYPDGKEIPGHDLYLDDGRYYYGATKDELKAAALNSHYHEPLVKAAIAAPDLTAAKARREMDLALGQGNAPKVSRSIEDNHVWVGSMDALLAGAGRKDVRAGVMTLLATIDTVKVTEEGRLLKLSATDFGGSYTENLYVDAETGVPQKFVGGETGKEPSVTIDYDIKRVTAANWADAAAADDAGQAPAAGADRPTDQPPARPAKRP